MPTATAFVDTSRPQRSIALNDQLVVSLTPGA